MLTLLLSTLFLLCLQPHSLAKDFTYEALRLLEEEPETSENADKLKDDKAHTLLWLFICTLEENLQKVTSFYHIYLNREKKSSGSF